jgi:hypothetical protein
VFGKLYRKERKEVAKFATICLKHKNYLVLPATDSSNISIKHFHSSYRRELRAFVAFVAVKLLCIRETIQMPKPSFQL